MHDYNTPNSSKSLLIPSASVGHLTLCFLDDSRIDFYPELPLSNRHELAGRFIKLCALITECPQLALHAFECCQSRS
jgi:hypothetical protein